MHKLFKTEELPKSPKGWKILQGSNLRRKSECASDREFREQKHKIINKLISFTG